MQPGKGRTIGAAERGAAEAMLREPRWARLEGERDGARAIRRLGARGRDPNPQKSFPRPAPGGTVASRAQRGRVGTMAWKLACICRAGEATLPIPNGENNMTPGRSFNTNGVSSLSPS